MWEAVWKKVTHSLFQGVCALVYALLCFGGFRSELFPMGVFVFSFLSGNLPLVVGGVFLGFTFLLVPPLPGVWR